VGAVAANKEASRIPGVIIPLDNYLILLSQSLET